MRYLSGGGNLSELKIEEGEIDHFEAWPIEKLFNLTPEEKTRFIPSLLDKQSLKLYRKIQKLAVN